VVRFPHHGKDLFLRMNCTCSQVLEKYTYWAKTMLEIKNQGWAQWLKFIIPATQEALIRRNFKASLGKKFTRLISTNKSWVW
jgi:hypothetical protein